jgi:zinc D-Ala-D-Ala carboxypeptidase
MPVNLEDMASKYFKWKELLYLPSWNIYHTPSDIEIENLTKLAHKMDEIRDYLENPVNVNCAIRPMAVNCPGSRFHGKNYNQAVGGAQASAHIVGLAMDFTVSRMTCDDARFHLKSQLNFYNVRMENKPGAGWVHLDLYEPKPNRFFIP